MNSQTQYRIPPGLSLKLALLLLLGFACPGWSATGSELSRWLSAQPVAQLRELLSSHPRYISQRIAVRTLNSNALTDALHIVLEANLRNSAQLVPTRTAADTRRAGQLRSVDELQCNRETYDYELQLAAQPLDSRRAEVRLQLVDMADGATVDQWRWLGTLNNAERDYADRQGTAQLANGQLDAPWREDQVAQAAAALAREFVCGLRPWIGTRTTLNWAQASATSNDTLTDTLSTSQHYIAAYRELSLTREQGLYRIETRSVPLSNGIWQLWITALPQEDHLPTVEAATYLRSPLTVVESVAEDQATTGDIARDNHASRRPGSAIATSREAPLNALRVEVVGVNRQVSYRGANIHLRLRLANTSDRPLAYGLKTSGGHFAGCRGQADSYQHDGWGTATGRLGPGETKLTSIVVNNVRHHPNPLHGQSACAGFVDLGAFANYAGSGARVTDYLRWDN